MSRPDEFGSELAVVGQPGDQLVMPANLVAKRWSRRETGWLADVVDAIADRVRPVQEAAERGQ